MIKWWKGCLVKWRMKIIWWRMEGVEGTVVDGRCQWQSGWRAHGRVSERCIVEWCKEWVSPPGEKKVNASESRL